MSTEVALRGIMFAQSCVKIYQLFQNLTFIHIYFMVLFYKMLILLTLWHTTFYNTWRTYKY